MKTACLVVICFGLGLSLYGFITTDKIFFWFGVIIAAIGVLRLIKEFQIQKMLAKNYSWYKKQYPKAVDEKGQASCFECNSKRIHTKNLMNQTYVREHHCGNCGKTLYYSPEKQ